MKKYEEWKLIQRALDVDDDGLPGPRTLKALAKKLNIKEDWREVQKTVGSHPDGEPGKNTASAVARLLDIPMPKTWPTQAEARSGKSIFGKPGHNLTTITLPFPLRLSWDLKTTVSRITVNVACADEVKAIYAENLAHYGIDKIQGIGLDIFGGCYNNRPVVGGSLLSMHGFGGAIDVDPERNQLKWGKDRARLAKSDCEQFWSIVERHGGVSLGREKNYDWMHFQFMRLN